MKLPWRGAAEDLLMACQSVSIINMDEQALLGLNPNADACYRQKVSLITLFVCVQFIHVLVEDKSCGSKRVGSYK